MWKMNDAYQKRKTGWKLIQIYILSYRNASNQIESSDGERCQYWASCDLLNLLPDEQKYERSKIVTVKKLLNEEEENKLHPLAEVLNRIRPGAWRVL